MWQSVIPATNAALLWLILVTVGFYTIHSRIVRFDAILNRYGVSAFWGIVGLAIVVRLLPALWLPVGAGYDIESYRLVGQALLSKQDVYTSAAIGRHPYLPMQMYFIALSYYLAEVTFLPFVVLVKLPMVIADSFVAGVIWQIALRANKKPCRALRKGLLYALNPVPILVCAYHGQFESFTLFLLLLTWYYWSNKQGKLSAVALGSAILNKTWPIMFLPILIVELRTWRKRTIFCFVALLVPILFTCIYVVLLSTDPWPMLERALTHSGNPGWWGLSALLFVTMEGNETLLAIFESHVELGRYFLILGGLASIWITRKQVRLAALLTAILVVFSLTPGIGVQWMVWAIPFAILVDDESGLWWFTLTASLFLIGQNYGYHMYPWLLELFGDDLGIVIMRLSSVPAWITVVFWVVVRLYRALSDEEELKILGID